MEWEEETERRVEATMGSIRMPVTTRSLTDLVDWRAGMLMPREIRPRGGTSHVTGPILLRRPDASESVQPELRHDTKCITVQVPWDSLAAWLDPGWGIARVSRDMAKRVRDACTTVHLRRIHGASRLDVYPNLDGVEVHRACGTVLLSVIWWQTRPARLRRLVLHNFRNTLLPATDWAHLGQRLCMYQWTGVRELDIEEGYIEVLDQMGAHPQSWPDLQRLVLGGHTLRLEERLANLPAASIHVRVLRILPFIIANPALEREQLVLCLGACERLLPRLSVDTLSIETSCLEELVRVIRQHNLLGRLGVRSLYVTIDNPHWLPELLRALHDVPSDLVDLRLGWRQPERLKGPLGWDQPRGGSFRSLTVDRGCSTMDAMAELLRAATDPLGVRELRLRICDLVGWQAVPQLLLSFPSLDSLTLLPATDTLRGAYSLTQAFEGGSSCTFPDVNLFPGNACPARLSLPGNRCDVIKPILRGLVQGRYSSLRRLVLQGTTSDRVGLWVLATLRVVPLERRRRLVFRVERGESLQVLRALALWGVGISKA